MWAKGIRSDCSAIARFTRLSECPRQDTAAPVEMFPALRIADIDGVAVGNRRHRARERAVEDMGHGPAILRGAAIPAGRKVRSIDGLSNAGEVGVPACGLAMDQLINKVLSGS